MQLQYSTVILLARTGDEQAIQVIRSVENNTNKSFLQTSFYFQEGPGIFYQVNERRRDTILGMPAFRIEDVGN